MLNGARTAESDEGYDFLRGRPIESAVDVLGKRPLQLGRFGKVQLVRLRGRRLSSSKAPLTPVSPGSPASTAAKTDQTFALRTVTKAAALRLRLARYLREERRILLGKQHPFIQTLIATGQDQEHVYMLYEFAHGGTLFTHLRAAGRFEPDRARFYAVQLALALGHLHERCGAAPIVHRDVRPESVLLDRLGFVKLSSFIYVKQLDADHPHTWTLCGTPEYSAPEMLLESGHDRAVDWWAFGVTVFELLAGFPPFCAESPLATSAAVIAGHFTMPRHFDPDARALLRGLLQPMPRQRLGNLRRADGGAVVGAVVGSVVVDGGGCCGGGARNGADGVLAHAWFKGVELPALLSRIAEAPLVPVVNGDEDDGNYEVSRLHGADDAEDASVYSHSTTAVGMADENQVGGASAGSARGTGTAMRGGWLASADAEEAALLADF